jgi:hypothetical protein
MKKTALILLAASALSACGGSDDNNGGSSSSGSSGGSSGGSSSSGSGSSSSGAAAQGVYCGSFTASVASSSSSGSSSSGSSSSSSSGAGIPSALTFCGGGAASPVFFGMVEADGTAVFFTKQSSNFVLYAPAQLTEASFSVPVTAYGLNGSTVGGSAGGTDNGTFKGSATTSTGLGGSTTNLSGTFTDASSNIVGFLAASDSAAWNRASSLATVAGSYSASFIVNGTTYTPPLTISTSGAITGTDTAGCNYGGSVATPDTAHNDYTVSLTSSCLSGTFNGIGAFFPAGLTNPNGILSKAELKVGLTGGSTGIYLNLTATK